MMFFRPNGDVLSFRFAPDGSMSSAYMFVKGESWDVTNLLPGLDQINAIPYLVRLGYHETDRSNRPEFAEIERQLNERGLSFAYLKNVKTGKLIGAINNKDRSNPVAKVQVWQFIS